MHGIRFLGFKVQDRAVKPDHMSEGHCERLGQVDSGNAKLADGKLALDCPAPEGRNEVAWRKEVAKLAAERDAKKKAGQREAPPER